MSHIENKTESYQNKRPGHTGTRHTWRGVYRSLSRTQTFNKVNMRQCDSRHAAVAPGAISLSQPLSHNTGRGEHRRTSTLGKETEQKKEHLTAICHASSFHCVPLEPPPVPNTQTSSNCCRRGCFFKSVWLQVANQWRNKTKQGEEATA